MNEWLFLGQALVIILFALAALRMGQGALTSLVVVNAIIANLFVLKQIDLFGFTVTASDSYIIGSLLGLNFLQEYYGRESAQRTTWICFLFMTFFAIISQIHLYYTPSMQDTTQPAYAAILSVSPRLLIASMSVFFLVQQFDVRFFAFLKSSFPSLDFSYRTTLCLVVSQLIDTVLFSFAGLYGVVASIFDVIFLSYAIKLIAIFFVTPFIRWAKT